MPLTASVLKLIDEALAAAPDAENPYVFAGIKGASVADRSEHALRTLKKHNAIGFAVRRHDLRRTASTLMQAAGIPPYHVAKLLNHRSGEVASVSHDLPAA